jgi:ATP synthase protein I
MTFSLRREARGRYNSAVCFSSDERAKATYPVACRVNPPLSNKPVLIILKWQAIATFAIAAIAGIWVGGHGALSAVLGGVVSLSATVVYAVVLRMGLASRGPTPAAKGLVSMFRAEAAKIVAIVAQLWFVLTQYRELVALAFFAAFIVTVLLSSVGLLARDAGRSE